MTDQEWTEEMLRASLDDELSAPLNPYVRFDEREDVLSSLELLSVIAPLSYDKPLLWKWMIIGAQSALQGAMVCALVDSTGTSVLKKKSAAELLDWLQAEGNRGHPPKEWLEDFELLLKKCVRELALVLDAKQRKDITRLHGYFRNSFIHFTPKGWGIEKVGLPRIIGAALDVIERLMSMEDRLGVRLDESQSRRFRSAVRDIRTALENLGRQLSKEP